MPSSEDESDGEAAGPAPAPPPTIDELIHARLVTLARDLDRPLDGFVATVLGSHVKLPRRLRFLGNRDALRTQDDVDCVADLAVVLGVALDECDEAKRPCTVTLEVHLRGAAPAPRHRVLPWRRGASLEPRILVGAATTPSTTSAPPRPHRRRRRRKTPFAPQAGPTRTR